MKTVKTRRRGIEERSEARTENTERYTVDAIRKKARGQKEGNCKRRISESREQQRRAAAQHPEPAQCVSQETVCLQP